MCSDQAVVKQPRQKRHKAIIRKIRNEHGYPVLDLPKTLCDEIGLRLNQEVVIERVETNPLNWEFRIKPLGK